MTSHLGEHLDSLHAAQGVQPPARNSILGPLAVDTVLRPPLRRIVRTGSRPVILIPDPPVDEEVVELSTQSPTALTPYGESHRSRQKPPEEQTDVVMLDTENIEKLVSSGPDLMAYLANLEKEDQQARELQRHKRRMVNKLITAENRKKEIERISKKPIQEILEEELEKRKRKREQRISHEPEPKRRKTS